MRILAVLCVVGLVTAFSVETAEARNPNRVFRGKILFGKKAFHKSAKSANAFIRKLKKNRVKQIRENKENKTYKIYYAAFFERALKGYEITVKIYDISGKRMSLVSSFQQYVTKRGMKSYISKMILNRADVGVNKRLLIVLEEKGKKLASGKIEIVGEREKFKGKVTFSEDET